MLKYILSISLALSLMGCGTFSDDASSAVTVVQPATSSLQHVWSVDVDQRMPAEPAGFSQAAVSSTGLIVIGGQDARVHIYYPNGREFSRIAIHEPCDSMAATLNNGLVVLSDVGGNLYAIDPEAGRIAWQYQLSSPSTGKAVVFDTSFMVQTTDNRLYRISETGEKLWSYAGSSSTLSLYLNASPLVIDDKVYTIFSNGDAVALDIESGDVSWRRQLLLDAEASVLSELRVAIADPVFLEHAAVGIEQADDVLLVAFYQGDMLFLSKKDGSQQFSHALSIKSSPVLVGQTLFLSDAAGTARAIDQTTGQTLWQKKIANGELVGPVIWENKLWFADSLGFVIRLNMDGSGESSRQINGSIDRLPIVSTSGVLIRTNLGALHLFN